MFGVELPLVVRQFNLSHLLFGEGNIFASPYFSDSSSFDNGNLVEPSARQ
jgi:hypothetical protein